MCGARSPVPGSAASASDCAGEAVAWAGAGAGKRGRWRGKVPASCVDGKAAIPGTAPARAWRPRSLALSAWYFARGRSGAGSFADGGSRGARVALLAGGARFLAGELVGVAALVRRAAAEAGDFALAL